MLDIDTAEDLKSQARSMWHPMASPMVTSRNTPVMIERGDGVHVWDTEGNRFFDAMSGLWCVNIGHNRAEVKQAIVEQLDRLEFHNSFLNMTHPNAVKLAATITRLLGEEGMQRVFFSSGGSDAVESALKIARIYWRMQGKAERTRFVALNSCYHGMHFAGTALNGQSASRTAFGPTVSDCFHVETPYLYRNPWTSDPEELASICCKLLERQFQSLNPDTVAAFIAEPVQGIGGVIVPHASYWPRVREICDRYGILLIADEVVTGFGRSGAMSGSRGWGIKPDIMCLAKGLTSGYIPMGATAVGEKVAQVFEHTPPPQGVLLHGYTYSGHPVAAAAALASLEIVERDNLPENARVVGEYMLQRLNELRCYAHVGDVRGKGLMAAIELVSDRETKTPLAPSSTFGQELFVICRKHGTLVRAVGSLVIFSPPLISTKEDIDGMMVALTAAFHALSSKVD